MNYLSRWDNPIFQRVTASSERVTQRHRRRSIAAILALVGILTLLLALLISMYPSSYGQQFVWMFFPAWTVWVIYAVTVLQTIVASVGILSAEYTNHTWESLSLTGISPKRILLGNWLAALHRIRGWLLFLALSRIAVLPIYLLVSVKVAAAECGYPGYPCVFQPPTPGAWTLAIGLTVIITIADIMCCSLIGLAVTAITRRSGAAAIITILLRFFPLFVFLAFGYDDNNFWAWWASPPFALVDGGTAPAVQLIMPLLPDWVNFNPQLGLAMITTALAVLLPVGLAATFLLLRRATEAKR